MFPILKEKVLAPLKEYLENNVIDRAKNADPDEKAYVMNDFLKNFIPNHDVSTVAEVQAEGCQLTAYKLRIMMRRDKNAPAPTKKAFIYMPGNDEYVASCLPDIEPLIRKMNNEKVDVECFCQDYYRGSRYVNPECEAESTTRYSIERDAKDQAALIKKVMWLGYKPEDIVLYGHSYGSAVALWAIYYLIADEGLEYANLKFFCERGYGTLLDFPFIKNFCDYPGSKKEESKEILALPAKCEISSLDSQLATHSSLQMKSLIDVKAFMLLQALLLETPIKVQFSFTFPKVEAGGYAMKADAKSGSDHFVALPQTVYAGNPKPQSANGAITMQSQVITGLLRQLHDYCVNHVRRGVNSGLGGDYKKGSYLLFVKKWTLREQLQKATHLMACLSRQPDPDWQEIMLMKQDDGCHKSGKLAPIFNEITKVAEDCLRIENFNKLVLALKWRRDARDEKVTFLSKFDGNFFTDKGRLIDDYLNPGTGDEFAPDLDELDETTMRAAYGKYS